MVAYVRVVACPYNCPILNIPMRLYETFFSLLAYVGHPEIPFDVGPAQSR